MATPSAMLMATLMSGRGARGVWPDPRPEAPVEADMGDEERKHGGARHLMREIAKPPIGQSENQQSGRDEIEDETQQEDGGQRDLLNRPACR